MNDSVTTQAGNAGAQIREKASEIGQSVREIGSQVKGMAHEQVGHLRDRAQDYYQQGREKADEWRHDLESYVREQPMKSLLMAAGVGLLLGFLWRRS
jgi:ElaB/YqjD/DUF883 family membrane-anchored ribosome-binding protein